MDQIVVGSWGPNDIQVVEGDEITLEEVNGYLHYIIRFQNTGTASAINVKITNLIDSNLDWETMQIDEISHLSQIEIIDGEEVQFIFNNINLPSNIVSEEDSKGYIQYKIKPKNTVDIGDAMSNNADIFFDFNPAVATNIVTTTVIENLSIGDYTAFKSTIYPNPTTGVLNINSNTSIVSLLIFNQLGQVVLKKTNNEGIHSINIDEFTQGIYYIKLGDVDFNYVIKKLLKE